MATPTRHPTVLWAQRENVVYLTIELHDAQDAEIDLKEDSISFSNTTDELKYAFHLDFYKPVKPESAKKSATGFKTMLVIDKKDGAWWPRLTANSAKPVFLKTDFDHWRDEDEEEEETEGAGFGGMDFSQLGGMGGMPGMGGMGGMPGMGGMDFSQLGGQGGMPDFDDEGSDEAGEGSDDEADAADKAAI